MARKEGHQGQKSVTCLRKLCWSSGHIINELMKQIYFSFALIFLIKVAELPGSKVGLIFLIGQVVDGFFNPFVGYCSDNVTLPLLGRCLGRRKAWHLVGTIGMAVCTPLVFSPCFICHDSSQQWLKVVYYTILICLLAITCALIEIGHLAIITELSQSQKECVALNTLRAIFTYVCGIVAYGIAWIVLGQGTEDELSPRSWRQFTLITCVLTGGGLLFSGVIFHIWTTEPSEIKSEPIKFRDLITRPGLMSIAMVFTMGINAEKQAEESRREFAFPLRTLSFSLASFDESTDAYDKEEDAELQDIQMPIMRKLSVLLLPYEIEDGYDNRGYEGRPERSFSRTTYDEEFVGKSHLTEGTTMEAGNGIQEVNHTAVNEIYFEGIKRGKSILATKVINACHWVEVNEDRIPRTKMSWLMDRKLYAVATIFSLTRLIQDASYSYMPFYLTDNLLFPTEAIAYFPLIFLTSGLFGTIGAKMLNKRLGSKWTYCLSAAVIIASSIWMYFLTPSLKSLAYAPTIILGIGLSAMLVMALAFTTALIEDNKETTGFVFSANSFIAKMAGGVFFMAVQAYYPSSGSTGPFIRYVFSLSLGIPAALGILVTIFVQESHVPNGRSRKTDLHFPDVSCGTQVVIQEEAPGQDQLHSSQDSKYDTYL